MKNKMRHYRENKPSTHKQVWLTPDEKTYAPKGKEHIKGAVPVKVRNESLAAK